MEERARVMGMNIVKYIICIYEKSLMKPIKMVFKRQGKRQVNKTVIDQSIAYACVELS
jgi:hypothetical protein